jgi:hypothetical protein
MRRCGAVRGGRGRTCGAARGSEGSLGGGGERRCHESGAWWKPRLERWDDMNLMQRADGMKKGPVCLGLPWMRVRPMVASVQHCHASSGRVQGCLQSFRPLFVRSALHVQERREAKRTTQQEPRRPPVGSMWEAGGQNSESLFWSLYALGTFSQCLSRLSELPD